MLCNKLEVRRPEFMAALHQQRPPHVRNPASQHTGWGKEAQPPWIQRIMQKNQVKSFLITPTCLFLSLNVAFVTKDASPDLLFLHVKRHVKWNVIPCSTFFFPIVTLLLHRMVEWFWVQGLWDSRHPIGQTSITVSVLSWHIKLQLYQSQTN